MRPQFQGRASRATVALCATTLAAGAAAPAAGDSTATTTTTPGPEAHIAVAPAEPRARARARARARRRHRHLAPRLEALMRHRDVLAGGDVAFVGSTTPALAHHAIHVQARLGRRWIDVAGTRTTGHGHFIARYWPHALGTVRTRLRIAGADDSAATLVEPTATVFHEAVVSWYGPGGTTACGETLEPDTLGVANLTLPCGTPVTLRYHGRTITVPVIDRGPYVPGREFDLTYATKVALGAGGITVVWASA